MHNQHSASSEKRLAEMTLFALAAHCGRKCQSLETVYVGAAALTFYNAVCELTRLPKPLKCTAESDGRTLFVSLRGLEPRVDGEYPYYMAVVRPEANAQYFGKGELTEWAESRLLLRGREDEMFVTAQEFVDWQRDYWVPQAQMLFRTVRGDEDTDVRKEVYFPPREEESEQAGAEWSMTQRNEPGGTEL